MFNVLRRAWGIVKKEDGLGTVEIVLIIAVLVGLALIFRGVILEFLNSILDMITGVGGRFNPANPN